MIKIDKDEMHAKGLLNSIDNQLKIEALIDLLIEKKIITEVELNEKYKKIATEKKYKYAADLFDITEEEFKSIDQD
jgi:methyltransferase-like protein